MTEVSDSDKALNQALWAVMNERFTDAAAAELWSRPEAVWGLFAVPERELGVLGSSTVSMSWSWPAVPPTSPRGWPEPAPGRWPWTSRTSS